MQLYRAHSSSNFIYCLKLQFELRYERVSEQPCSHHMIGGSTWLLVMTLLVKDKISICKIKYSEQHRTLVVELCRDTGY